MSQNFAKCFIGRSMKRRLVRSSLPCPVFPSLSWNKRLVSLDSEIRWKQMRRRNECLQATDARGAWQRREGRSLEVIKCKKT